MKLIRVKKKDEVNNPVGDLIDEICTTQKWFGNKNYFVYFTYLNDELYTSIVGPQSLSVMTNGEADNAKDALKNIKQCQKDLEQAIAYAEKTKKDFEKRIKKALEENK